MWDYRETSMYIDIIYEDTIKWIGFDLTLKEENVFLKR